MADWDQPPADMIAAFYELYQKYINDREAYRCAVADLADSKGMPTNVKENFIALGLGVYDQAKEEGIR